MIKSKRKLLLLSLIATVFMTPIFFTKSVEAQQCDNGVFPYGLYCGNGEHNGNQNVNINVSWAGRTIGAGQEIEVNSGASIQVDANFGFPGNARNKMLVWFVVNGPVQVTESSYGNSLDNFLGGTVAQCPGTSGSWPRPVYGYRDQTPGGAYTSNTYAHGSDMSSYAYDSVTGRGTVNCGAEGRMLYYQENTPPSAGNHGGYGFRFNFRNGRDSGGQCVNIGMYVSMDTNSPAADWFPGPASYPNSPYQQSAVASRFVAMSNNICVKVKNNPPTYFTSIGCSSSSVWRLNISARDPDYPPNWPVNYRIARVSTSAIIHQGTTDAYGTGNPHNITGMVTGARYKYQIEDINTASIPGAFAWVDAGEFDAPNCLVDHPPTGFIENNNCNVISVAGINDFNDPGAGLHVVVRAWPQDGPRSLTDNRSITLFDGRASNRVDVGVPEDLSNIGWEFDIYIYNIGLNAAGNPTDSPAFHPWNIYQRSGATGSCYQATCSIDIVEAPGLPEGGVIGGENFTFNLTIYNTGWPRASILPDSVGGNQLTGSDGGGDFDFSPLDFFGSGAEYVPRADQGSNAVTRTFSIAAPDDINSRTISIYPDYYGRFAIGPVCSATVHTYQHFRLEPRVNSVTANDYEDPTEINYKTMIDQRTDVQPWASTPQYSVPATSTRSLYWKRGGINQGTLLGPTTNNGLPRFNDVNYDDTYNNTSIPRDFRAGDEFCAVISVYPATGQIGPGDDIRNPAGLSSDDNGPNCRRVVDRPYVRYYGSDVFAGGQFGSPGAGTGGDIRTYIKRATNVPEGSTYGAGSGVEFAAFALGLIQVTSDQSTGFTSASLRSAVPSPPSGLSFATNSIGSMGGNFAATRAATDYFNVTKKIDTAKTDNVNSLNLATLADNQQSWVSPLAGNKTNLTNGAAYNVRHAVYVDGDVLISGNIVYAGSGGWATLDSIPNFSLIVRGNIYIANNVTQLDGLYVAQPTSGTTGGRIYTCVKPDGSLFAPGEIFDNCRTKLKVNGSFVAQDTRLLRTHGTLSDVGVAQLPQPAVGANPGHDLVWTYGPATRPNGPSGSQTLAQAQANTGKNNCVEINEPWSPVWNNHRDNWLCYDEDLQLSWNWGGTPLAANADHCVSFNNPNSNVAEAWADDRLCWPNSTGDANFLTMVWDSAPPTDRQCTAIVEYGDAQAWGPNKAWLCYPDTETPGSGLRPLTYVKERFNGPDEDHAAESFRLPPDLYLSNPVFKAQGSRSNGKYDQVLSLPPVL